MNERGGERKTEREEARGGEPETRTGIEIRQTESYWKKRRGREGGQEGESREFHYWSVHAPDWSLHTCATHELHSEL